MYVKHTHTTLLNAKHTTTKILNTVDTSLIIALLLYVILQYLVRTLVVGDVRAYNCTIRYLIPYVVYLLQYYY